MALELYSMTGNGRRDLRASSYLWTCLQGRFRLRSLMQLVTEKASDVDIWAAVLRLVTSFSPHTPPTRILLSFDGTSFTQSSASQQGSEQTKPLLETPPPPRISFIVHIETSRDSFRNTFGERNGVAKPKKIYTSLKDRHVDGRWTDFP